MKILNVLSSSIDILKRKGIIHVITSIFYSLSFFIFYKKIKRQNTFLFRGNKYYYFCSLPNSTWLNERSVEIPIVMEMVKKYHCRRILEIGNVLSNYLSFEHDIVDKYEIKSGIINQDVTEFKSTEKYDLIVSISTLEHVGWDETLRDDMKIPRAIENLKSLVRPEGGLIIVTLPIGYNLAMDRLLEERIIQFTEQYHLVRLSKGNEWKEVSWKVVQGAKYGSPFPAANGLVVGIIKT